MKSILLLCFTISLLLSFSACKKEPGPYESEEGVNTSYNYDHYNGKYYGVQSNEAQSFYSSTEYDVVTSSKVVNNQVVFLNEAFDLSTPDIVSFSQQLSYPLFTDLNFSPDFEQVTFNQRIDAGVTKVDVDFLGQKTVLDSTDGPEHPLKNQLEGLFQLQVSKYESLNGVDITELDTLLVSMSGYDPVINSVQYNAPNFYSFYNSAWSYGYIDANHQLYWVEDSIYLNYFTVDSQSGVLDTVHHIYEGVRL